MKKHTAIALMLAFALPLAAEQAAKGKGTKVAPRDYANTIATLQTDLGEIQIKFFYDKAPKHVENFVDLSAKGFYDGTFFHRVIPGFMIQGGGMQEVKNTLQEKKEGAFPPIKNESKNGLTHVRGVIAMARMRNPDSASSQFFIDHADRPDLDRQPGGYTVFGKVIEGMDVVDAIAKTQTTTKTDTFGTPHDDVPVKPILIKSTKRKS